MVIIMDEQRKAFLETIIKEYNLHGLKRIPQDYKDVLIKFDDGLNKRNIFKLKQYKVEKIELYSGLDAIAGSVDPIYFHNLRGLRNATVSDVSAQGIPSAVEEEILIEKAEGALQEFRERRKLLEENTEVGQYLSPNSKEYFMLSKAGKGFGVGD